MDFEFCIYEAKSDYFSLILTDFWHTYINRTAFEMVNRVIGVAAPFTVYAKYEHKISLKKNIKIGWKFMPHVFHIIVNAFYQTNLQTLNECNKVKWF